MHMCLFGSQFNCDVINGVAATRATKMVLVTVSSTPGYFADSNNSKSLIITFLLFLTQLLGSLLLSGTNVILFSNLSCR